MAENGAVVHVAIGANVGDVRANLAAALRAVDALDGVEVLAVSPLYRTAPVGGPVKEDGTPDQPDFHNGAFTVATTRAPGELMEALLEIELTLGRVRTIQDGPRVIDLDIVLWEGRQSKDPRVVLPHPRMAERGFVLKPLADIAPEAVVPGDGRTVGALLAALPPEETAGFTIDPFPPDDWRTPC